MSYGDLGFTSHKLRRDYTCEKQINGVWVKISEFFTHDPKISAEHAGAFGGNVRMLRASSGEVVGGWVDGKAVPPSQFATC